MPIELEVIAPVVIEEKIDGDFIRDAALDDDQTKQSSDGILPDGEVEGDSEAEGDEAGES